MAETKGKRRTCADRMRADMLGRKIRRRKKVDPAMSLVIQLLGLASAVIGMLPDFRSISTSLPEPPQPQPIREPRPQPEPRTYKHAPSWPKIMSDLARPVARSMALMELRARLPADVQPWLDDVVIQGDWSSLRYFAVSGATDETAGKAARAAFRSWQAEQDEKARQAIEATAGGGKASAGTKPGGLLK